MLDKLGRGLRWFGEKATTAASWIGSKAGGALVHAAPAIAMFNPALGGMAASAGMALKGVGAIGDMGKALLRGGGDFNPQAVRRTVDGIRSDVGNIRSAYAAVRGQGNPLERGR